MTFLCMKTENIRLLFAPMTRSPTKFIYDQKGREKLRLHLPLSLFHRKSQKNNLLT